MCESTFPFFYFVTEYPPTKERAYIGRGMCVYRVMETCPSIGGRCAYKKCAIYVLT